MKKITYLFAAMVAALGFSSCNETWDDNPTLATHEGDPVGNFLNTPVEANTAPAPQMRVLRRNQPFREIQIYLPRLRS